MPHKIRCVNPDCSGKMIRVYTGTLALINPPMKPWIWLCPICESKRHGGWDRELSRDKLSILQQRIKDINPRYELADPQETIASSYTGEEPFEDFVVAYSPRPNGTERDSIDTRRITGTITVFKS